MFQCLVRIQKCVCRVQSPVEPSSINIEDRVFCSDSLRAVINKCSFQPKWTEVKPKGPMLISHPGQFQLTPIQELQEELAQKQKTTKKTNLKLFYFIFFRFVWWFIRNEEFTLFIWNCIRGGILSWVFLSIHGVCVCLLFLFHCSFLY